ncbi:MAG: hypothetical protein JWM80_1269 [Cyanobacteria bacterium RYN_339]|nr:hypothetical protein [Cyanobacteria bacterium RYN_339]
MRAWMAAVLAATLVMGCDRLQGGGGGSATAPSDNRPAEVHGTNPQLSRDFLGDALVAAARVHQALAVGRTDLARPALKELRDRLAKAGQAGTLEQQRLVNGLDAASIEIEGFMERQMPEAVAANSTLVKRLLENFDQLASVSPAGGGGGGPTPTPAPTAGFDELDPGQLLENKPR